MGRGQVEGTHFKTIFDLMNILTMFPNHILWMDVWNVRFGLPNRNVPVWCTNWNENFTAEFFSKQIRPSKSTIWKWEMPKSVAVQRRKFELGRIIIIDVKNSAVWTESAPNAFEYEIKLDRLDALLTDELTSFFNLKMSSYYFQQRVIVFEIQYQHCWDSVSLFLWTI